MLFTWKLQGGEATRIGSGQPEGIRSYDLNNDGRFAVIRYLDQPVLVFGVEDDSDVSTRLPYGSDSVSALTVAIGGRVAMAAESRVIVHVPDGTFQVEVPNIALDEILALHFTIDGKGLLVCGVKEGVAAGALWSFGDNKWQSEFRSTSLPVKTSDNKTWCMSRDGRSLIVATVDRQPEMWDIHSGKLVRKYQEAPDELSSVVLTPDARFLAAGGQSGFAGVWDTSNGRLLTQLLGPESDVTCAEWLSDGNHLAVGYANGEIWVWEVEWDISPESPVNWKKDAHPLMSCFLASLNARRSRPAQIAELSIDATCQPASAGSDANWTEQEFNQFLQQAACWGYGSVSPEEFESELRRLASGWPVRSE